jgi:hypothetical protein
LNALDAFFAGRSMKQEFDKQLDSLLRGTRGAGEVRRAAATSEHLSPDELSAYAENAMPQAARALYTAHIADCADCRRVVTSVALASGAESVREARPVSVAAAGAVASKTSWGARLAALLSPRVLAYAAPVLAVAIIGALALVVLRGRQGAEAPNVAQRSGEEAARPGSITQPAPAAGTSSSMSANTDARPSETQGGPAAGTLAAGAAGPVGAANAPEPAKVTTREEEKAELAKDSAAQPVATDEAVVAEAAPKPAPAAPAPGVFTSTQSATATAAAPPPPETRPDAREADDKEESRQQRPAANVARSAERDEDARGEDARRGAPEQERGRAMDRHARDDRRLYGDRSKSDGTVPSETENLAASRKRSSGPARGAGGASAERRVVEGHEFRRQGGAWVDMRYSSSMSTVKVRRGSESFRSLVADIPEVGRAAAQLPGTVIIVARGRAYRID